MPLDHAGAAIATTVPAREQHRANDRNRARRGRLRAIEGAASPRQRCRDFSRRQLTTVDSELDGGSGVAFYRKYTVAMLRRYLRVSMEVGRVPSCMPREAFRGTVTSYRVRNFEDGVIFAQDMERCLALLDSRAVEILTRVVIQDYSQEETAKMLGYSHRHLLRILHASLDKLTDILIERELLKLGEHVSSFR